MKKKPNLILEYRFKEGAAGTKVPVRFRCAQDGSGSVSISHGTITPATSKLFKPLLTVIKKDYAAVGTPYQHDSFVTGLTRRDIIAQEAMPDGEGGILLDAAIFVARHTGAVLTPGTHDPKDWVLIKLPKSVTTNMARVHAKRVLRAIQTLLTNDGI
jgi:hypothetical protein